jgi:hypothetical protein
MILKIEEIIRILLLIKSPFFKYIFLTIITILLIDITRQSLDLNSAVYNSTQINQQIHDYFDFQNR